MTAATQAELMDLARRNVRILEELAAEFEVSRGNLPALSEGMRTPEAVASYYRAEMGDLEQEQLWALLIDFKNQVVGSHLIYQGAVNGIHISIRDVFREAIRRGASGMFLVHNHPSGLASPSPEDVKVTKEIIEAGRLLDVDLLDHLIVGKTEWVSLKTCFGYLWERR